MNSFVYTQAGLSAGAVNEGKGLTGRRREVTILCTLSEMHSQGRVPTETHPGMSGYDI